MGYMFYECSSLITIPLLDTSNVTDLRGTYCMFSGCRSLTNLGGFKNLQKSLDLTSCTKLTHESLMNVINNLARVNTLPGANTSPVLTLGGINLAKLTYDEIAIATDKGWILN
jgi:surface protein